MSAYKLTYEETDEDEFTWLAIHSSLINFRMAYFLNQSLKTHLKIVKEDIKVVNKNASYGFTHFEFFDKKLERYWKLVENKAISNENIFQTNGLFDSESIATTLYFLPEFKKVDYILKIDTVCEQSEIEFLLQKIASIPQVASTYLLPETIQKSKNNLLYKV